MDITQIEKAKKEYADFLYATKVRGDASADEKHEAQLNLFQLSSAFMPKTLFRYRSCGEYDYSALLADRIYFNRPRNFNDPHDCLIYVDPNKIHAMKSELETDSLVEQLKLAMGSTITLNSSPNLANVMGTVQQLLGVAMSKDIDGLISEIAENGEQFTLVKQAILNLMDDQHSENQRSAKEDIFIACFSEHLYSTTMWAHYANNHKGFVLEYDTSELLQLSNDCYRCKQECDRRHVTSLYPVLYSEARYDATEFEIETYKARLAVWMNQANGFTSPDIFHDTKLNTLKGFDWEYEGEWRLLYTLPMAPPINYAAYEIIRPKAIYFGSQMPDGQRDVLKRLIGRENGSAIKMYEMKVDTAQPEYKIRSVEVTL